MAKHFKFLSKITTPQYREQVEALIVELGLVPIELVTPEVTARWNQIFHQRQHEHSLDNIQKEMRDDFMAYFLEQYHHRKDYYEKQNLDLMSKKQLKLGFED